MHSFSYPLSETIFKARYVFHPEETWEQASSRVSDCIARAESDYIRWSKVFNEEISNGYFMPGGRIWYGAGRPISQLLNCFVIPTEDSREGWAKSVGDNIIIAGTGGGNGQNYSNIRPRGSIIRGTGGYATGSVSLMKIENAVLEEVRGGASRRAARMMCLNIDHPDIEEFLNVKLDLKQLNNANISVVFMNDPEEFFDLVKNDLPLELKWQGQVVKTVSAKELWFKIVANALKNGEPGILNGYLANHLSNISYCRTLVSTNPCGEIFMQPYSTCCLGAVVLSRFVKVKSKASRIVDRIDWDALRHSVTTAVRFLDDVLDITHYPTEDLRKESKATRRIGVGIMGLHYFLLLLGLKYSSEEARELVDKVMGFIKLTAYDASISLAIEKGPFPEFDAEKFCNSNFVRSLKPSLQYKIKTYGIRNCAILTIAPTGTTSMVMEVSSGIEPIFAMAYERKWRDDQAESSTIKTETVVDPLYKQFLLEGLDVSHFEGASDIHPEDHLKMQVVCQKHIDNAVSKTINLPQGMYNQETLSDLYMKYFPLVKGLTIYPMGSRGDSPLTELSEEQARQYVLSGNTTVASDLTNECPSGVCQI